MPNARRRTPNALPLHGLLVADFSRVLAGPLCTQMLADAGARVIKIEDPRGGDETRRWGPPFVRGVSAYFLSVNRNKESVAVDLKSDDGKALAAAIVARADVVVDNFLPSQRRALLPDVPPTAVHCSISGFDADAPDATLPGYDLLAQASSGLMAITGEPGGSPMKAGVALSDVLTANHAVGAICAALYARERSGRGARIEVSLFSSTLASLVNVAQSALLTGREAARWGNAHGSIVPYQLFHASDRPFVIGAGTDRHFADLCGTVAGRPDLVADARFATNAARVRNRDALIAELEHSFRVRKAATWVARCRKAGVPAALVAGVREALRTANARAILVDVDHPVVGHYVAAGNPLRYDGARFPQRLAPPLLGEQTEAIRAEFTGTRARRAPRTPRKRTERGRR